MNCLKRKKASLFLGILMLILLFAQYREWALLEPEYPLKEERIYEAMESCKFPDSMIIEKNDYHHQRVGINTTSFTLKYPTQEVFAGHCIGILSHQNGKERSLGLNISTIDKDERFSMEECQQAIQFASYLFWGRDLHLYESFSEEWTPSESFFWEKQIRGVECQIYYRNDGLLPLQILIVTNKDAFDTEYLK